jgi:hypothetical protein
VLSHCSSFDLPSPSFLPSFPLSLFTSHLYPHLAPQQ